jgi:hypothetical protein
VDRTARTFRPGVPGEGEIRPVAAPRAAEVTADRLAGDVATGHGARDLAGITLVLHEPDTAWAREERSP